MSNFADIIDADAKINYELRFSYSKNKIQRFIIRHKTKKHREALKTLIAGYHCMSAAETRDLLSNCYSMYPPYGSFGLIRKTESTRKVVSGVGVVFWTSALISDEQPDGIVIDKSLLRYKDNPYRYTVTRYIISIMCNDKNDDIDISAQLFYKDAKVRSERFNLTVKNFDCSNLRLQEDNMRIYLLDLIQANLTYTAQCFLLEMLKRSERIGLS